MRECPRCEACFEDEVLVCPTDEVNTKLTLPGGRLLASRYHLEKRLGRGAMGQVYLGRDQNLVTRRVAIKTVRPDILNDENLQEGEAIARFEREARAAASISHPNVVHVSDFGQSDNGVFFLVMEYVEGETLHHLLRREGTLSVQRTSSLLGQVVAGVDAAHDAGILHRDLKPGNIFIMQKMRKSGGGEGEAFVKVGDFGLAKIVSTGGDGTSASGPASRGIVGTPEYMAPEQMQTGVELDVRADVYALGTIAYHMLGGRPPFAGDITQLIAQKLLQEPPSLLSLRSDLPASVERVIMRALARESGRRPSSAVEWFDQFQAAASNSGETPAKESRVIIMAPAGAEVYVDDERHGSVGSSGRVILKSIPPGQHVLRVARSGEPDDERVIVIRPDGAEQIIQAQVRGAQSSEHLTPSRGGSLDSRTGSPAVSPGIVVCTRCQSRFAAGIRFCGRCGNATFAPLSPANQTAAPSPVICQRCGSAYAPNTKFCGRCGISIEQKKTISWNQPRPVEVFCKTCHTGYPAGTRFCGKCGTVIKF